MPFFAWYNSTVMTRKTPDPKGDHIMADIKQGRYRHFKGNEYEVVGIAKHSETLEEMVVYRALYGDGGLWVRPASMWLEEIDRDGYKGPRFIYVGAQE